MEYQTILGVVAGFLTTSSFLPQLFKVIKTKSAHDISAGMLVILCSGIFLWIVYGVLIDAFPVIISNLVSFLLVLAILVLKIRY